MYEAPLPLPSVGWQNTTPITQGNQECVVLVIFQASLSLWPYMGLGHSWPLKDCRFQDHRVTNRPIFWDFFPIRRKTAITPRCDLANPTIFGVGLKSCSDRRRCFYRAKVEMKVKPRDFAGSVSVIYNCWTPPPPPPQTHTHTTKPISVGIFESKFAEANVFCFFGIMNFE